MVDRNGEKTTYHDGGSIQSMPCKSRLVDRTNRGTRQSRIRKRGYNPEDVVKAVKLSRDRGRKRKANAGKKKYKTSKKGKRESKTFKEEKEFQNTKRVFERKQNFKNIFGIVIQGLSRHFPNNQEMLFIY